MTAILSRPQCVKKKSVDSLRPCEFRWLTAISSHHLGWDDVIQNGRWVLATLSSVNTIPPSAAYMRHWIASSLVLMTACGLFSIKTPSKPMNTSHQSHNKQQTSMQKQFSLTILYGTRLSFGILPPFCPGRSVNYSISNKKEYTE